MKTLGTRTKLGLLTSLYLSQGLPFGFFTQALPVLLDKMGLSLPAIGLAHLLAAPWALKFVWSPWLDRRDAGRFGRRRGVILATQVLSVALLALLSIRSTGPSVPMLLASVLLVNLLAATQDIATDGLAVDILSERELGWGNGIQVAGYRVGMILGGGLMLYVFDVTGFRVTLLALAAILLVATVPIALFREKPVAPPPRESPSLSFWWNRPGGFSWLGLLFIYKFGEALAAGMLRPYLINKEGGQLDAGQLSWMLGTVGFTAGLVGALMGGGLVRRLGYRSSLLLFGVFQAATVYLYSFVARSTPTINALTGVCTLEHLTSGMATAALFTAMMEASRPDHAATDYTVQASVVVIATGGAAAISGFSAHAFGFSGHFAIAATFCALAVLFVALAFPKIVKAKILAAT